MPEMVLKMVPKSCGGAGLTIFTRSLTTAHEGIGVCVIRRAAVCGKECTVFLPQRDTRRSEAEHPPSRQRTHYAPPQELESDAQLFPPARV